MHLCYKAVMPLMISRNTYVGENVTSFTVLNIWEKSCGSFTSSLPLGKGGGTVERPKAARGRGMGRGYPLPVGRGLGWGCAPPQKMF
jgi:hypothetical protein